MYEYNVPKPVTLSGSKEGNLPLVIEDAEQMAFGGLSVYGKSTQDGTPSPESPVPIEIPGSGGSVDVNVYGAQLLDLRKGKSGSGEGVAYTANSPTTVISSDEDIFVKAKYYKQVQEPSNVNPIIFEW